MNPVQPLKKKRKERWYTRKKYCGQIDIKKVLHKKI